MGSFFKVQTYTKEQDRLSDSFFTKGLYMKDTRQEKSVSNLDIKSPTNRRFYLLDQNQLFLKIEEIRQRSGAQTHQQTVEDSIHLLSVMGYFVENLNAQVRIHFPDGTSTAIVLAPQKEAPKKAKLMLIQGGKS